MVGSTMPRKDAMDKVTGKSMYVSDFYLPDMLFVKVLRSPYPYAKIISIDTEPAKSIKGVRGVFTAKDCPGKNRIPIVMDDLRFLAEDYVRFHGEPVALVAGETEESAEQGVRAIKVTYKQLQGVFDPLEAMKPDAPKIYGTDNIFKHWQVRKGDVDKAMREADLVIENEYRTPHQEHAYLEPQGMLAVPTEGGGIQIIGSMQCPFYVREGVSWVLGIPLANVRVVQATTGGGFGGKEDCPSIVAAQAALVAFLTGRPTRIIYTREEDILSMSKRHAAIVKSQYAFKKDGTLIGARVKYYLDAGAYSTLSPVVAWRGTVHSVGPYKCPNVEVDTWAVATNNVPSGAFRGFGSPQVLFAAECQMDEAAYRLGLDPFEIRRRNILRDGDETPTGQRLKAEVGLEACVNHVIEASHWYEKRSKPKCGTKRRGIGCSTVFYGVSLGAGGKHLDRAGAFVQVMYDGSAVFGVGTTEMGQGMQTVLSQIVAEELGLPYENIRPIPTDTHIVPDSGPTVASRTTVMSGQALINAIKPIKEELQRVAGEILECNPNLVTIKHGIATRPDGKGVEVREVLKRCLAERSHLASSGWAVASDTSWDINTGRGDAYITYAFAANVVEVEVDIETGEIDVLNVWASHDVGKAINPQLVEGQIEGGVVQGLGYALMEKVVIEQGIMKNNNLSTYLIPTAVDAPNIEPIIVEKPSNAGPYGAKGFGEQPLMGIAPAVANAIFDAIGMRFYELPITPEKVFAAIKKGGINI